MLQIAGKTKVRSMSPESRAVHKQHHLKAKLAKKSKQHDEHERHSARRSRTPVRRDVKTDRTPDHRINSPNTRIRVSVPNNRVQDRSAMRSLKDSPSTSRRYVREAIDDRGEMMIRQKEHDKIRRIPDEDHYKYSSTKVGERSSRALPPARMTPETYHRERSRSQSGRVPIRERLDKDYEYRRSDSREREDYPVVRTSGTNPREQGGRYEYRGDDRRLPNHEYGQSSRVPYDERHHHRWDESRGPEPDTRPNRIYEGSSSGKNWEPPVHDRKRMPEDAPYKERQWNESGPPPHDKWPHSKDKDPQDWKRSNWKDQSAPTMPHPRRWPGPNQMGDGWNSTRGPPPPHKMDSSSGPPFKPRGTGPSYFGYNKRFPPFKRFPNQYSKINFPSKRVIPSATTTQSSSGDSKQDEPIKTSEGLSEQQHQIDNAENESGELTTEAEEEKIAQPDTTFSGTADAQYQEECEGNLSEFSDVDDDILNRDEVSLSISFVSYLSMFLNILFMSFQVTCDFFSGIEIIFPLSISRSSTFR